MECFRRPALIEQTFAGRELELKYGDRLMRSFAALTDALNRHRGKGSQQVVRVEHVTVQAGGQAIVGNVTQGGGGHHGNEDRAYAPEPEMRSPDPSRQPLPVARGIG